MKFFFMAVALASHVGHRSWPNHAAAVCPPWGGDGAAPRRGVLPSVPQGAPYPGVDYGGDCHYWL